LKDTDIKKWWKERKNAILSPSFLWCHFYHR